MRAGEGAREFGLLTDFVAAVLINVPHLIWTRENVIKEARIAM